MLLILKYLKIVKYFLIVFLLSTQVNSQVVEVWLTTPDQNQKLNQQVDLTFSTGNETGIILDIDDSITYQTIDGFGASMTGSSAYLIQTQLNSTQRDQLLNDFFTDTGISLSMLRHSIGASDFNLSSYTYNDIPQGQTDPMLNNFSLGNDLNHLVPALQETLIKNPSLKIIGSPWTAPAWMKENYTLNGSWLDVQWYSAYADYLVKYIQEYQNLGIPIWAISIQNEPLLETSSYPSMRMDPANQVSFLKNDIGPAFQNAGITTGIMIYDHNWDEPDYPIEVLDDNIARDFTIGSAFHGYAGDVSAQTTVHNAHPDKGIWFTEISGGDFSPNFQDNLSFSMKNTLIGNLRNWSKSVLFWNLALDENNGPKNNGCQDCRGVVTIDSSTGQITKEVEYYVLGHASKFIDPGAQRIFSTDNNTILNVAFKNPDGTLVMIAFNDTSTSSESFSVKVGNRSFNYDLSSKSAVTFKWDPNNMPPDVTLTSPTAGDSFITPTDISLTATASTPNGNINLVEFYANNNLIGSDDTSPYSINLSDVPAGSYDLMAKATNNQGLSTESSVVSVLVDSPIIPNGTYQIFSEVNNEALASPVNVFQDDSSNSQINNLFATTSNPNDDYQLFQFIHQGNDVYKIKNSGTNKYVGLKDDWCGDFGEVIARFNESDAQAEIKVSLDTTTGEYLFQNNDTNACSYFDLSGGGSGAKIRTFNATGANQRFRLLAVSRNFDDGIYRILSEVNNEFLQSPTDVNQDDSSDATINNLFVSALNFNNDYQKFELTYQYTTQSGEVFRIKNLGTNQFVGLKDNFCGDFGEVIAKFGENDNEAQILITRDVFSGRLLFQKRDANSCSYFDLTANRKIRTFDDTGINQQFRIISDETFIYDATWLPADPTGTGGESIFVLNGTYTTSTDVAFKSILISGGASIEISPTDVLTLSEKIINNGSFTFKSDASGSAQLADASSVIINGDITVERFIPAGDNLGNIPGNLGRAFRFLTSTVTTSTSIKDNWQEGVNNIGLNFPADNQNPNPGFGTHISGSTTGSNGFDATPTGNPSMFTFNNASTGSGAQDWKAIPGTDSGNNLKAGRAYLTLIRGNRSVNVTDKNTTPTNTTLRARGNLAIGQIVYDEDVDNLATQPNHFSLVANPYQAVVNYVDVDRTNLTDHLFVWDASINERGGYVSVDFSDVSNIFNNVSSSDADNFLAPGQAFFVQNNASGNTALTFNEDDKDTTASQVTVFNTNTDFVIRSNFYKTNNLQNGDGLSDGLMIRFNNNYTTSADDEDATKLTNPDENFAVVNNGLRSIDKQALPNIGHEIDLSITSYRANNYSLTFDISNKPDGLGVFLNDTYLNTQLELTDDAVYDFSVDENIPESIASNRFNLKFDNTTLGLNENTTTFNFNLYPNPTSDGKFTIKTNLLNGDKVNINVLNILGQNVLSLRESIQNDSEINVDASKLYDGIYIINLKTSEGINKSFKLIKN